MVDALVPFPEGKPVVRRLPHGIRQATEASTKVLFP